jgi:hypothetical protein
MESERERAAYLARSTRPFDSEDAGDGVDVVGNGAQSDL